MLVKKPDDNTKITEIEKKIPIANGLVTAICLNTKAPDIEKKIRDLTTFAIKAVLKTNPREIEKLLY